MASGSDVRTIEVNRPLLLSGVVLISAAALLGTVGGIATMVAVAGAARSWARQLDEPPSVMARRRLAQARSAAMAGALAGAEGWRQYAAQNGNAPQTDPTMTGTVD
jgi:hypothetical protein